MPRATNNQDNGRSIESHLATRLLSKDRTVGEDVETWGGPDSKLMCQRMQLLWKVLQVFLNKLKLLSSKLMDFIQKNQGLGHGGGTTTAMFKMTSF